MQAFIQLYILYRKKIQYQLFTPGFPKIHMDFHKNFCNFDQYLVAGFWAILSMYLEVGP